MQQSSQGFNWVSGERGAKSWLVGRGETVLLMDSETVIPIKTIAMRKIYLDSFMDMCNGEILSYGIDKKTSAKNVMDALDKVIEITSDCPYRRTFHSD